MKQHIIKLGIFIFLLSGLTSCLKEQEFDTPEAALFTAVPAQGTYRLETPGMVFRIPVGLTKPSAQAQTINISVESATGAVEGTHYSLSTKSITIPAGQVTDTIVVSGVYDQYESGRKDTLVFRILGEGVQAVVSNAAYTLAVSGPCFEGDVDLNILLGDYAETTEDFDGSPYGPYTTSITSVSSTGPTSGTITVGNIFDYGWNDIVFKLDWSDPDNRTITLDTQTGIANGSTLGASYAGESVAARALSGSTGTFSVCNQTLTLVMDLGTVQSGFFGVPYVVTMER